MSFSGSGGGGGGDLPSLIPNLPDDIAARCIALLPLSSHPCLSLVSRSWRYLLRSPHLFQLRDYTEPLLLLCVRTPSNLCSWLLIFHHPHGNSFRNPLPLPSPPLTTVGSSFCALGPTLYLIGGSHANIPTRNVQILDLRTRRWSPGPSMSAAREFPSSAAIKGRIYTLGGCLPTTNTSSSSSWAESLDPTGGDGDGDGNNSHWAPLPSPVHLRDKWMHGSAVLDGKLLAVADRGGVVFDPLALTWGPVPKRLDLGWKGRAAVVGGVLYTYDYLGKIKGYDPESDQWRKVEGLEKKLPVFLCGATLASFGGLLCLVWEEKGERRLEVSSSIVGGEVEVLRYWRNVVDISCAGIDISKEEEGGRLTGKVVWLERAALPLPKGSSIVHCVELEL